MNQKNETGLFDVLEKELKARKDAGGEYTPVDCVTLYNDSMEVRALAANPNRVSDYLGNMWRKGQLVRLPAPRGENSKTRWLYAWKGKAPAPKPNMSQAIAYDEKVGAILDRANLQIEEDGERIVLTLPNVVITIQQRNRD